MVNGALFDVNRSDGTAIADSVAGWGVGSVVSMFWDSPSMYYITTTNRLVKETAGAEGVESERIASLTQSITGVTQHSGTWYAAGDTFLFTLNLTTGALTRVGVVQGTANIPFTPSAIASDGTTLYAFTSRSLGSLNITTAAYTEIGSLGFSAVASRNPPDVTAAEWDGTTMYFIETSQTTATDALYTVNRTTGAATRVGNAIDFGLRSSSVIGTPRALAWVP